MWCKYCKIKDNTPHNKEECKKNIEYYQHVYHKGKSKGWSEYLDFSMTACNRVELIKPTCESLQKALYDVDLRQCTIYCNVDPLLSYDKEDKVKKCLNNFFKTVVINKPETASFAKALKWCWMSTQKPLTFHLEDDWLFLKPFSITELFHIICPHNVVSSIQLYKGEDLTGINTLIRLSPSLHKTKCIKQMAQLMNDNDNPEGQLRLNRQPKIRGNAAIYLGLCYKVGNVYIRDIGTEWRCKRKIFHSNCFFNTWNK